MSLISYIEHLKTKPEHVRRRFAFWSSLGTTGLIFVFWLATYNTIGSTSNAALAQQQVNRVETPNQTLTASVGHFFTDIRDMIFTPKKIEYKPIEVVPGKY
jgi:heme/copper-type cytochrome/quinol oxidase subunit 3